MLGVEHGNTTTCNLHPTSYLAANTNEEQAKSVALVILNTPLTDYKYFDNLYNHAAYQVCADGGANRLHDLLIARSPKSDWDVALRMALPDAIHGDLDSLRDSVRDRYRELGVEITRDPDQYSTDFAKSIKTVIAKLPEVEDILVMGSIGGRVDQGIGLLHELYREQKFRHPSIRFWLFSENSITVLLKPGTTIIATPLGSGLIAKNVGILPLYGRAIITTKGLEWDVEDWPTELGGQVSTSNHVVADQISIKTDMDVLFTVQRIVRDDTI